jgi:NAD(P)-dependent dehydrogenase (short-subunit alcohol dehydrogenase family)
MSDTIGVVTGAASGMGLACARSLAARCDGLVVADLAAPTEADREALGRDATLHVVRCDVTDPGEVAALARTAARAGEVRAVVHAAGVSPSMGDAARMFEVDLAGTALVVDAFEPVIAPGGAVVLFASMAAHLVVLGPPADPGLDEVLADPLAPGAAERFVASPVVGGDPGGAYAWAKRGVLRLVARKAAAYAARGARINSVSPGSIDTPMGRQELASQPAMAALVERTPVGRLGQAGDLVAAVDFLLSDAAAYVTGTDILVDGGVVASLTS